MSSDAVARVAGPAAALGGLLWVPYGVFEMLEPWGAAKVYRDDIGYALVTDARLFVMYSLPGALALLLTSLGLLGVLALLGPPAGRTRTVGRMLAYAALALAALSLAGVIALFDPVFTAARIFGTLALGAAAVLASLGVHRAGAGSEWMLALLALGLLGLFLLPLWPLVYAVELVPTATGAAFIALFGLGWAALGTGLLASGGGGRRLRPGPSAVRAARVVRSVLIAVAASLAAGLVAGLLARGAMRILALAGGVSFEFPPGRLTVEGTLAILLVPMLQGIPLALLLLAIRRYLPRSGWRKPLSYGVAAFIFPGLLLLTDREFNLNGVNQVFGRILFAPIYFVYGYLVGVVIERVNRSPLPSSREDR